MLDEHLSALQQTTFQEYIDNKILRGYIERTLQVCVQICLDVGGHLVAELGFRRPVDNRDIFRVLAEEQILPDDSLPDLFNMAGFRNIVVHDYARIDNALVFGILQRHLIDFKDFANAIVVFVEQEA